MATCGGAMKGEEINFAVIKNNKQHRSSPSQHMADLYELEYSKDPVHAKLLWNPDGRRKVILSLEVDGGPDENPGHAETRWLLAECMVGGPRLTLGEPCWSGLDGGHGLTVGRWVVPN